ncbi:hypothetical protein C8F04DRAFT_298738 [Mycena alexandri]|uniref:MYND-type domain-containing protein n=1 Tax=Mycena alexandri TaxID=1745969 RepID=A0AAD6T5L2_9AGAR|nr:hypothetical protein C8F04DRAFT_298738 [Mycena alexandri]
MDICALGVFNDPNDTIPSTACIMFVNDPANNLILGTGGNASNAEAKILRIPAAVFPNLSGSLKDAALKLQQQNLAGFHDVLRGVAIEGPSPQELLGFEVHFGHCSEIPALLYMFDPLAIGELHLHGAATEVAPIRAMRDSYNAALFKRKLKRACTNCHYMVRALNDALGTEVSTRRPSVQYHDRAGTYTTSPQNIVIPPSTPKCTSKDCPKPAWRQWECGGCRMAWYCSADCRRLDVQTHARSCARYFKCDNCQQYATTACGGCLAVSGRIPARYCGNKCQRVQWDQHKLWCIDTRRKGPVPSLANKYPLLY